MQALINNEVKISLPGESLPTGAEERCQELPLDICGHVNSPGSREEACCSEMLWKLAC